MVYPLRVENKSGPRNLRLSRLHTASDHQARDSVVCSLIQPRIGYHDVPRGSEGPQRNHQGATMNIGHPCIEGLSDQAISLCYMVYQRREVHH